ncbi:MAG: TIGR03663 family protein [Proteobacteria bacterium]|nr:TIGR03663 family protein [Pseudomonadota bacterium]
MSGSVTNNSKEKLIFWMSFILILIMAIFLRFFEIELRPPHNDESVNFLFYEQTNRMGYYPYSHENYHGPLYFYIITALINIFGDSLIVLRASAIAAGISCILFLAMFQNKLGKKFVILASLFIATSPSLLFFSRYAIHETLLTFGTLMLGLSLFYWMEEKKSFFIYLSAFALAILITTKETFPIALISTALPIFFLYPPKSIWQNLSGSKSHIIYASLVLILLTLFTFSAGFRWYQGISEMFLAFPQWFARSKTDVGHFKPFFYYLSDVIAVTEPHVALAIIFFPVICLIFTIQNLIQHKSLKEQILPDMRLTLFLAFWTIVSFLFYSQIKYKTVWLIINITLPAQLFLASLLSKFNLKKTFQIIIFILLLAVILKIQITNSLKYNYSTFPLPFTEIAVTDSIPYGPGNPYSYVHTSKGTVELVAEVEKYWQAKPDAKILVGVNGYFPLPYYFRKKVSQCAYAKTNDIDKSALEYDIMILDFYTQKWDNPSWDKKYYRLSDYQESYTYFKKQ